MPSASTITEILRRNDRLDLALAAKHTPFTRFEHPNPNDLWQMDFKGEFRLTRGWCYPLTILDDHSRFALCLSARPDLRTPTTTQAVREVYREVGLPRRMTMDNGSPWGTIVNGAPCWTGFAVWLIRLGIHVSRSRPHHPQTQGKNERFHRTLAQEVLRREAHETLDAWQQAFDQWRAIYNHERPHEAIGLEQPHERCQLVRERGGELGGEAEQLVDEELVVGVGEPTLADSCQQRGDLGMIDGAFRRTR